jgi:cell wall-associated NlpC family hydrolase
MAASEETTNVNQSKSNAAQPERPWSFFLVVVAILSVTIAFLIIMVLYSRLNIFDKENAAKLTAALSSLFGIVGTLVGAYFGIKATAEAQGKVERTQSETLPATQQTVKDISEKAVEHQKQAVEQQKAATATVDAATSAAATQQRAIELTPMSLALVLDHRDFDGYVLKSVELKSVNSVHRRVGSHSSYLLWASTSDLRPRSRRCQLASPTILPQA